MRNLIANQISLNNTVILRTLYTRQIQGIRWHLHFCRGIWRNSRYCHPTTINSGSRPYNTTHTSTDIQWSIKYPLKLYHTILLWYHRDQRYFITLDTASYRNWNFNSYQKHQDLPPNNCWYVHHWWRECVIDVCLLFTSCHARSHK